MSKKKKTTPTTEQTQTTPTYYWCYTIDSQWRCSHHVRCRPCPSPKACHEIPRVEVRDRAPPRPLSVGRRNHGTNGDIVIDTGEVGVLSMWATRDRAAAVRWAERRNPAWGLSMVEDAEFAAADRVRKVDLREAAREFPA